MNTAINAINYGIAKLGIQVIEENQRQVVEAYLAGRDVLMVSPTGSGKSLTFQIAAFVYDYLKHGEQEKIESICLVVVPLLSLMRDQVAALKRKGIAAVCLFAAVGAGKTGNSSFADRLKEAPSTISDQHIRFTGVTCLFL